MPIFSNNTSYQVGNVRLESNSAYYNSTVGQVMSESVMNDNNIFCAMVNSDMNEITMRYEGTMLEAEFVAQAKDKVSEIFKKIKNAVVATFKKLKALLDAAITNVIGILGKDLSKKANKYSKYIKAQATEMGKIELKKFRGSKANKPDFSKLTKKVDDLTKGNLKDFQFAKNKDEYYSQLALDCVGATVSSSDKNKDKTKAVKKAFLEDAKDTKIKDAVFDPEGNKGVDGLLKACTSDNNSLKDLRETKKKIDKACKDFLKTLSRAEKQLKKDGNAKIGDTDVNSGDITNCRTAAKALQSVSGSLVNIVIGVRKYEIKRNASALSRCISKLKGKDLSEGAAYVDFMANCAFNEAAEMLNEKVDEDTVNKLVDATPDDIDNMPEERFASDDLNSEDAYAPTSESYLW